MERTVLFQFFLSYKLHSLLQSKCFQRSLHNTHQLDVAAFSFLISLVAQVARVLVFETLDRRPCVSSSLTGSTSNIAYSLEPNAAHKSLKQNTQNNCTVIHLYLQVKLESVATR